MQNNRDSQGHVTELHAAEHVRYDPRKSHARSFADPILGEAHIVTAPVPVREGPDDRMRGNWYPHLRRAARDSMPGRCSL
jgi:hypothetical protein